jgi:hypothetical protein
MTLLSRLIFYNKCEGLGARMKNFEYWLNRAKAVKVINEQTNKAYQYLMGRALAVMVGGKEWTA